MQIKKQKKNISNLKKFKMLPCLYDITEALLNINEAAWINLSWMKNVNFQVAIFQKTFKIIWRGVRQSSPC